MSLALRADSNDELKREVDIWYRVMYENKNEDGKQLQNNNEIKEAKYDLIKRVGHISTWDVSSVTNMSELFKNKTYFNDDISNWIQSNVTDMESMFSGVSSFNQPLENWNVSNVTDVSCTINH